MFPIDPENRQFEVADEPMNRLDGPAIMRKKEERIRESWIRIMEKKILENHLADCVFKNQVNAESECRTLAIALASKIPGAFVTKQQLK